jgi:hypothetical protein
MTLLLIAIFVVLPIALLPFLIKSSRTSRTGADLSRAGLLELQSQLEPERKVEILREMEEGTLPFFLQTRSGEPCQKKRNLPVRPWRYG